MEWRGVISAITTPFKADYSVDHAFLAGHAKWQVENGVDGIVALGSLGEAATLSFDEKVAILKTLAGALGTKPLVAGIASLSTQEAVSLARGAGSRLRGIDGAAAVRLQHRLARDEGACIRRHRRNETHLHAL